MKENCTAKQWAARITLDVSEGSIKRLKKGKRGMVMKNGQLYELKCRNGFPKVFDEHGKLIPKFRLKALLK